MVQGRHSEYKPEFCERVKALGKDGLSIAEMSSDLGFAKQTIYTWMKQNPDFLDAMKEAVSSAQAWYEKQARTNMVDGKLNTPLWIKVMSSRFREDYTDIVVSKTFDNDATEEVPESQLDRVVKKTVEKLSEEY